MRVVCLDLEGVLIPEMWIELAEQTGIEELRLTTRDIADYDELMKHRIAILERNSITIRDINGVTDRVTPLDGAESFLRDLRSEYQVAILSDTFVQFAGPVMKRLGYPFLLCNSLEIDDRGMITGYALRQHDGKRRAVEAFRSLNVSVAAVGDSFNDISMLRAADVGVLFRPSETVRSAHEDLDTADSHPDLSKKLLQWEIM
ncbi:MAG: bifunctional phosphoserine phosphatase/homoserine phosphotransferase ThrH [Spirochaetales bacterium]